jgi:hypothetical protein
LDRKNHNVDLGEFNVADIADLACAPTGAAAHKTDRKRVIMF